jgi:hypothetical protein
VSTARFRNWPLFFKFPYQYFDGISVPLQYVLRTQLKLLSLDWSP